MADFSFPIRNMWHTPGIAVLLVLNAVWSASQPIERAETSRTSPFDLAADVKEAVGYNLVQRKIINSVHPRPIVDTMTEEEKYGNVNQHPIGQKVVKGVEGVSNLVNSVFEYPKEASRQVVTRVTSFLDNVGGKIVGLQ